MEKGKKGSKKGEVNQKKTSMGVEPNVGGLLAYLFGWLTGIIFLVGEKENKFVRFHAMQSLIVFLAVFVIQIIVIIFAVIMIFIPVVGWIISILLWIAFALLCLLTLFIWIFMMVKAYNGEEYKLPIVGDFAVKQLNK